MTESTETKVWSTGEILDWTRAHFAERGSETPRLDAEVLLAHVLACRRIDLYTRNDRPLNASERDHMRALVRRRSHGAPVAYLVGEREFWSLPFAADPRALIPRPETEVMVEECLAPFRTQGRAAMSPARALRVVDVGTGSGVVAVVLARELPGTAEVFAVDIDTDALALARENVARHGLADRVVLREGSLLTPVVDDGPFDLIAANLPYVRSGALASLPVDVKDYEPVRALDGGPDGLEWVRPCIAQAARLLVPGGWVVLELGDRDQIDSLVRYARDELGFEDFAIRADYAGRPRVVRLRSV